MNGFEVGLHYDPLLGKLIVHAPTRRSAIRRMARVLNEMVIRGVDTCIPFHRRVMDEPDFVEGSLSIQYLEDHPDLMGGPEEESLLRAAAVAASILQEKERQRLKVLPPSNGGGKVFSSWKRAGWPFSGNR